MRMNKSFKTPFISYSSIFKIFGLLWKFMNCFFQVCGFMIKMHRYWVTDDKHTSITTSSPRPLHTYTTLAYHNVFSHWSRSCLQILLNIAFQTFQTLQSRCNASWSLCTTSSSPLNDLPLNDPHSLVLTPLYSPLSTSDFGLSHMICLGQQDMSKHDVSTVS